MKGLLIAVVVLLFIIAAIQFYNAMQHGHTPTVDDKSNAVQPN